MGVGVVDGAMVNVGNPHFVMFVESEDFSAHGMSWQELGSEDRDESAVSRMGRMWSLCG